MRSIQIPRHIVNQILAHAQLGAGEEICGLISEKKGAIYHCYPIENTATDSRHFFRLDPENQIDALRTMRENGEELYAIYHSHPDSEAYPSATDITESQYSDVIYFIVSLQTQGVLDLKAFRIVDRQVEPLEVTLRM